MSRSILAGRPAGRAALVLAFAMATIGVGWPASGKLETWRQETSSAVSKGPRERVVIAETGRVRLGQALGPVGKLAAARVWDLARTADGAVFAATGDEGKVFRGDPKDKDSAWTLAYDAADTQALALAALPDGR